MAKCWVFEMAVRAMHWADPVPDEMGAQGRVQWFRAAATARRRGASAGKQTC